MTKEPTRGPLTLKDRVEGGRNKKEDVQFGNVLYCKL